MRFVTKVLLAATLALGLLITVLAFTLNASAKHAGQTAAAKKPAAANGHIAMSPTQNQNIAGYAELLHEDLPDEKAQILGVVLQLTPEEAAKFWPIFDQYNAEMAKLDAAAASSVNAYVKNFGQLSDQQADELVQKTVDFHNQREALLAKYYGIVKQAVGAATAARFFAIENQILLLIDLQMNSNLPVGS